MKPQQLYGLVSKIARSLGMRYDPDAWQTGAEAALRALPSWRPSKGKLTTFLWLRIRGALIDTYRTRGKAQLAAIEVDFADVERTLAAIETAPCELLDCNRLLQAKIHFLDLETQCILDCIYGLELSYDETGEMLGLGKKQVFLRHHKALDILRGKLQ